MATSVVNVSIASGYPLVIGGGPNPALVQTHVATALSDFDTAAASIIAITGDTYVAHQFVTGGSTGLSHAQWVTQAALLNTALTALLAVVTDLASQVGGDVSVSINSAKFQTKGQLRQAADEAIKVLAQLASLP